ncbi:MAG: hypothetical protein LBR62_01470, partial [Puniceicoccales bacterium]|nr:hypothetical protein [Puniceicoccales bacterium]
LKDSNRTYSLFSIAQLFLSKPERFVVSISLQEGSPVTSLFLYRDKDGDELYFTETEAFDQAFKKHRDEWFEHVTEVLEKPKGNFSCINQCGITGELIAPPNYHRYADCLRQHFALQLEGKHTFDAFLKSIKSVHDSDTVRRWLERECTSIRYVLKENPSHVFPSLEAARRYAFDTYRSRWTRSVRSAKIPGSKWVTMTENPLKSTIENAYEREKRFPIGLANFLRGRFHHLGLHLYKKGKRGVSYVCAVRRKIYDKNTSFSPEIQSLINFIAEHPSLIFNELAKKYLNLAEETPAGDLASNEKVKQMQRDLHWLVAEGYVLEYEDGRLSVP